MHENCTTLVEQPQKCPSLNKLSHFALSLHIYIPSDLHFQCESNGPTLVAIGYELFHEY